MCKRIEVTLRIHFSKFLLILIAAVFAFMPKYSFGKNIKSIKGNHTFVSIENKDGDQGIAVEEAGLASISQEYPVELEIYTSESEIQRLRSGYSSIKKTGHGFEAEAKIKISDSASISVNDLWAFSDNVLRLERLVKVNGNDSRSFMSGIMLTSKTKALRNEVGYFVPGMMYGSTDNLTPNAFGGRDTFESGSGKMWIREDRLPAPLFGLRFKDGTSIAVLNPNPDGATTFADSHDQKVVTLIDEKFQFGSIGSEYVEGHPSCGFWFPGTEGEVTYLGNTYPDGQVKKWRRRYHPLKDGLTQKYQVSFRFGQEDDFPEFSNNAWRWAWNTLKPPLALNDLDAVRTAMSKMLSDRVEIVDGRALIPNYITAAPNEHYLHAKKAVFGFTGKNLESAYFLLKNSYIPNNPDAQKQLNLGRAIIDTFTTLKMDPPVGEGFFIPTGKPALAAPSRGDPTAMYLRSFGDGMKAATRAYLLEKQEGTEHSRWIDWLVSFGDWLLTKQNPDGSFPRTFEPVTGNVRNSSKQNSYNVVPFLVLLSEATNSLKYLDAALKAADFSWHNGHNKGVFIGGTIDNPNVIDKEAGTLSLEAYLTLFEATKDSIWLERAQMAANFVESWIYIWNIPMPEDEDNKNLHWKKGVSTIGLQLISTGHTLVDEYSAFDADEFAKLWAYTKDIHYYEVSAILLHNTKNMVPLPDRPYDLNGPGWQQEHWSLAPIRGYGLHRGWLPWVTCSQLNGIFGIRDFDRELYNKLKDGKKP